jgi:coproporphyrinogen III oxidase-like Fe-S oxidoreductase
MRLPQAPEFLACIETSPLTVYAATGREKLRSVVNAGVRRVSIGVQTFDDHLLRQTRGHGHDIAVNALAAWHRSASTTT